MKNLLARNNAGLPLTPGERAVLKLVKYLGLAAVLSAAPVVAMFVLNMLQTHPDGMDWPSVGKFAAASFLMAFLAAGLKFIQAHFGLQSPVTAAATQLVEDADNFLRTWGGIPNDQKFEPPIPLPSDLPTLSAEPPAPAAQ
jgi:hypothetical protein